MTAGALQDLVLARVARAVEDPERAVRAEAQVMMMAMENGRPQDLARVNLGRAEVDQARVNQVSPRLYCFIN